MKLHFAFTERVMRASNKTGSTKSAGSRKYRQLTAEQEKDLIQRWRDKQDNGAGNALLTAFAPLVAKHALTFRHYGLPLDDLIQEGNLGLVQAAKGFDLERGVRFSTYAIWWIRAQIQDYVLRNTSIVRLGGTKERKSLFFKLRHVQAEMAGNNHGQQAESDEIAKLFNLPRRDVEQVESVLRKGDYPLSASHPTTDQELQGLLPDQRPDPEAIAMERNGRAMQRLCIEQAMSSLNERERTIILSRRLSDEPAKLETLGRQFGVSPERVRQIEQAALGKMRNALMGATERLSDLFIERGNPAPGALSPSLPLQAGV